MPARRLKLIYLLALFQLVSGPLILLQVVIFSRDVVREAPAEGIGPAVRKAWRSAELRAATTCEPTARASKSKQDGRDPDPDPKVKPLKGKLAMVGWEACPLAVFAATGRIPYSDWARRWTPVWPQAPPGPPPRGV